MLGWFLAAAVVAVIVLVLAAPVLVTSYLERFVRGDGFPVLAEQMIESRLGGRAAISPPSWRGDTASFGEVRIETAGGWQLDARAVHASVDFGSIRRKVWHVHSAEADELTLRKLPVEDSGSVVTATSVALPSWVRGYLPTGTEVDGFGVERFAYTQGGWQITDSRLQLDAYDSSAAGAGRFSIPGSLDRGALQVPVTPPGQTEPLKLEIKKAGFRLTESKLQLLESTLEWKDRSTATLRGSVKFGSGDWDAAIHAANVPVAEFLDEYWRLRLTGRLEGDLDLSGSRGSPMNWRADVALKGGELNALSILDQLATYTRMDRFKRLALDIATATVTPRADGGTHLEKIVVQSNGLLRIEGTLDLLAGEVISGEFMVGVTSEALRWLPGAESGVFVEKNPQGPPGLNWARVRVAGTRAAPQEDLSARLLGAAGMSLLIETPGVIVNQASDMLLKPVLGEDAAKLPGQLLDGGTKTLESGVKAGSDLINKVLPIFPGK